MTNEKPTDTKEPQEETKTEEETGGFGKKGNGLLEPTRYNDWEVKGRCSDF